MSEYHQIMRNGRPVILFNGSELGDDDVLNHILFIEGEKAIKDKQLTNTQQELDECKAHVEEYKKVAIFLTATKNDEPLNDKAVEMFMALLQQTPKQSLKHIQADYLQSILDKYDCGSMEYVLRKDLEKLRQQAESE